MTNKIIFKENIILFSKMEQIEIKPNIKKNKRLLRNLNFDDSHSDSSLSSDDEDIISNNVVGEIFNNRYFCLKYLGNGTFSKVWLVYDILDNTYYAMKSYDIQYLKESYEEIKIMNLLNNSNNTTSKVIKLKNYFEANKKNHLIYELYGCNLLDLLALLTTVTTGCSYTD